LTKVADAVAGAPKGSPGDDGILTTLQQESFGFFEHEAAKLRDGLFPDSTQPESPGCIASVGFALACYPVAVAREFVPRTAAVKAVLDSLRFFADSRQSLGGDASGYRGFYYHFLDRKTGRRTWECELSSIDTALLVVGALVAARYFDGKNAQEAEIRDLADTLYRRVEWDWMRGDGGEATVGMGWKPGEGFLPSRWRGFNEGLLLYVLALGSPTHPIEPQGFHESVEQYEWRKMYDQEFAYAGPLFIHQMPHCFIDFRGIQDDFMRVHDIDYFENSRRATLVQQAYAIHNPRGFREYGPHFWGVTASDGPGPDSRILNEKTVDFFAYKARGIPFGPDDGCVAPWAAVASLPFAPKIVLPTIRNFQSTNIGNGSPYGFAATVNPTFREKGDDKRGWASPYNYGLNQGPVVLMIENYRTEMIWRLMRDCPYIIAGLRRAGFSGGWLDDAESTEKR
jgi:hypothetical protein